MSWQRSFTVKSRSTAAPLPPAAKTEGASTQRGARFQGQGKGRASGRKGRQHASGPGDPAVVFGFLQPVKGAAG